MHHCLFLQCKNRKPAALIILQKHNSITTIFRGAANIIRLFSSIAYYKSIITSHLAYFSLVGIPQLRILPDSLAKLIALFLQYFATLYLMYRLNLCARLVFIIPAIASFIACNRDHSDPGPLHFEKSWSVRADSITTNASRQAALLFTDSVFAGISSPSPLDYYNYYQVKTGIYQSDRNGIIADQENAYLYADSMVSCLEKNHLEKILPLEYTVALKQKGEICLFQKHFSEAYHLISLARHSSRKANDSCVAGDISSLLGNIYFQKQRFAEAAVYFKESVRLFGYCKPDEQQYRRTQGNLDNIGVSFMAANELDSAIHYYKMAENYILSQRWLCCIEKNFVNEALMVVYENMLEAMRLKKDYETTLFFIGKVDSLNNNFLHDSTIFARSKMHLAEIALNKGNTGYAAQLLKEAKLILNQGDWNDKNSWYTSMSEVCRRQGHSREQAEYLQKQFVIKDTLLDRNRRMLANDPADEYQKLESRFQISELENQNEREKKFRLLILGVSIILLAFLVILFLSLRRSRHLVRLTRALNTDLRAREAELKKMLQERERLKEIELQEHLLQQEARMQAERNDAIRTQRQKISDDLHDELSSSLAALKYFTADVKERLQDNASKQLLEEIEAEVGSIYLSARNYMHNLKKNAAIPHYDFLTFTDDLRKKFAERNLLEITTNIDADLFNGRMGVALQDQLYHIVKESFANIIRHAEATKVNITLKADDKTGALEITDNGKGFNEKDVIPGLGLNSIGNRAKEIRGEMKIVSDETGTCLSCRFPLPG